MKNFLWVPLFMFSLISCVEKNGDIKSNNNALITKLDSLGQTFIDEGNVVGFAVAIMQGEDTVYNRGFGYRDLDQTKPITRDTRFLMASVSKLIGSAVVMKLTEEGKLSLDQSLFELLPDFPNQEQAKKITLRHMLSHTSGLQDYAVEIDSNYLETGIDPTREDYLNFFKGKDLFFEPGTNYSYCNSGFLLMAMIVERVTGNSFQEVVDRVINYPTGMNLKLIKEAFYYPEMSPYWEYTGSGFVSYPDWTWIKGDGGLTATPSMLAQFPRKWAQGVINKSSFEEMSTPFVLTDGVQTGYGIGVRNGEFLGEKIIGHTGGYRSTYAIMVYFLEMDLTFVCMMNTDNTPTSIRNVFGEFARIILNKEIPNYTEDKEGDLSVYSGTYATHDYKIEGYAEISQNQDGGLQYCLSGECVPMIYIGDHTFWIERWPYDLVRFHLDDGNAVALKEYYTGFYAVLRKKIEE